MLFLEYLPNYYAPVLKMMWEILLQLRAAFMCDENDINTCIIKSVKLRQSYIKYTV